MTAAYRLENVVFGYKNETPVLSIPKLLIKSKNITSLTGSNGAGKTTLLHLLAFLETPTSGHLHFFDEAVSPGDLLVLRRQVALVAQNPYLMKGSVMENILLGLRFRGVLKGQQQELARQALARIGMEAHADRDAGKLSGGEARKVALARALALQPRVLLLDEPFTHLDQGSVEQLESLLRRLQEDEAMTVVFSTHDHLQGMALADESISLMAGHPVDSPLLNLFHGRLSGNGFDTGRLHIQVPDDMGTGKHLVVNPAEIVLSTEALTSSMRNRFHGRVVAIAEERRRVWITVDAGEVFHAQITRESLRQLDLNLGSEVWVNFKSSSIKVF